MSFQSCGGECAVDYRITVPPGTSVTGSVDAGVLTLTNAATVDIQLGTGTIKITGATGVVHCDHRLDHRPGLNRGRVRPDRVG